MNETGTTPEQEGLSHGSTTAPVRRDVGEHSADLERADHRFENPGFPPHVLRHADVDEKAAKRAERQVLALFTVSILASVGFVVAYFAVDLHTWVSVPLFGRIDMQHTLMGVCLALSLLGIGLGAVHWAKTLMPDHEEVEERHPVSASAEDRDGLIGTLNEGKDAAQLGRRPLIGVLGATALGIFALPPLLPVIGGLGPLPGREMHHTFWQTGMRLMRDPQMTPIRADEVKLGSVFHILPEGIDSPPQHAQEGQEFQHDEDLNFIQRKAKAAVLLMRLDPASFKSQKARDWGYEGIVAYNKICTHAGCPVGLYEQQTHHLLCPCHQSTFDVTQDCKVIFGPAKRPLPQLKIAVDDEGYLVAAQPFMEPVGPSFWSRER
ncbi:cytochrome bc1 complex Rieske iron-sulfur subunit [Mobilicoccus caccae]|uniref:Cytochrome bc1 complex Rieske iron-sulfur subunit n=1 Tax=Mobilicoccus caccae TaxID=1859295 RepID=A0ABQ6IRN4_9MICO|nr:Rieske 2Fe-2S domain-containing protein [Mobilicoccus caccae]GMA39827.1 cytochrome bc1 complex Rieske iron-sulfur subunit [Mobilicoccus caccae]